MKVYVRWYNDIVEGELLDKEWQGMKQVRIPLDGCHPIALFVPEHVYQTEPEAYIRRKSNPGFKPWCPSPSDFPQTSCVEFIQEVIETQKQENKRFANTSVLKFKEEHWDHEHNHLRTDCLDEFYRLWRETHRATSIMQDSPCYPPFMKAGPTTERQPAKPAPVAKPKAKRTKQNTVQLSLFE